MISFDLNIFFCFTMGGGVDFECCNIIKCQTGKTKKKNRGFGLQ